MERARAHAPLKIYWQPTGRAFPRLRTTAQNKAISFNSEMRVTRKQTSTTPAGHRCFPAIWAASRAWVRHSSRTLPRLPRRFRPFLRRPAAEKTLPRCRPFHHTTLCKVKKRGFCDLHVALFERTRYFLCCSRTSIHSWVSSHARTFENNQVRNLAAL